MRYICIFAIIILFANATIQCQTDEDAKRAAAQVKEGLAACSERSVTANMGKSSKHARWEKQSWGPPTQILVDVKRSDSVLHPYQIIADFTLWWSYSADFPTEEEARAANVLTKMAKFSYQNIYFLDTDGIHLAEPRRVTWPDACWDHLYQEKQ